VVWKLFGDGMLKRAEDVMHAVDSTASLTDGSCRTESGRCGQDHQWALRREVVECKFDERSSMGSPFSAGGGIGWVSVACAAAPATMVFGRR
jgi:hypothetical protein